MKYYQALILLVFSFVFTGCFEDMDDNPISTSEINDFVWRGMNRFYLYKDDIPDLANDRFSTNNDYLGFLNDFSSSKTLFESLVYKPETIDRFSRIFSDYFALERFFDGIVTSNGMEFQYFSLDQSGDNLYGIVTHVLPGTSAEVQGIKRGDVFYGVNGTQLTISNRFSLLGLNNYTITLGEYNTNNTPETTDDFVTPTTNNVSLTKAEYTENPVLINKVINANGNNVAYLMYNGFTGTDVFNTNLNTVFGTFKNANARDLVLDLRYNSGGSVNTAILLSSLITGQFTGEVFNTEEWNDDFQEAFNSGNPELLINRFVSNYNGASLNSLNLNRVYILTTKSSASASELVINCLSPYINVVQIGDNTAGKYQASITVYDSPTFTRKDANINHTYAMQPLIYKSLNKDGETEYFDGLTPDVLLGEKKHAMGVLGDENEPLLKEALDLIKGITKPSRNKTEYVEIIGDSRDFYPFDAKIMYD